MACTARLTGFCPPVFLACLPVCRLACMKGSPCWLSVSDAPNLPLFPCVFGPVSPTSAWGPGGSRPNTHGRGGYFCRDGGLEVSSQRPTRGLSAGFTGSMCSRCASLAPCGDVLLGSLGFTVFTLLLPAMLLSCSWRTSHLKHHAISPVRCSPSAEDRVMMGRRKLVRRRAARPWAATDKNACSTATFARHLIVTVPIQASHACGH